MIVLQDLVKLSVLEKFEQLLESKDYKGATKIYWDRAYQYQKELHELIEKYDVKDVIFDILHGYHQMGEIEDQI